MNTLEDHGYVWRGSITEQDGAWLSYWVDDSSEGHRAHSSLARAKRHLRSLFGPLRYEGDPDRIMVYVKPLNVPADER